jgi:hypothetical protein
VTIHSKLDPTLRTALKNLLDTPATSDQEDDLRTIAFHQLKEDPGNATVANVKLAALRLKRLQNLELPEDLFEGYTLKYVQKYRQRAAAETVSELTRHLKETPVVGYPLLAAFCWTRLQEVTDDLIELFDQIMNSVRLGAERKVTREIVNEVK